MSTKVLAPLGATAVLSPSTPPALGTINRYSAASAGFTVTLPALSGVAPGAVCTIQKDELDGTPNVITVACAGSDTTDSGSTSVGLRVAGSQRQFQAALVAGTVVWKIIDGHDPLAALDGRYGIKLGNRTVFFGDSTTLGSDVPATNSRNTSWPTFASALSDQKICYVANGGVFGNTTAQMLARFDTAVTPYAPSIVTLLAGRNDIGGSVPFATFQANMLALIGKIVGIGARPVLCTITPTNGANGVVTAAWNRWIAATAARRGFPLLDFYALLVDPATGSYLTALDSGDHIHPSPAGYLAMGQRAAAVLSPLIQQNQLPIPHDQADTANILNPTNALFLNTTLSGNGEPAGWNLQNPAGVVASVAASTFSAGNAYRMTAQGSTTTSDLYSILPLSAGDLVALTGRINNQLTAGQLTIVVYFVNAAGSAILSSNYAFGQVSVSVTGRIWLPVTAPAGTASVQVHVQLTGTPGGYVELAQMGIFDLTVLGIAGLV